MIVQTCTWNGVFDAWEDAVNAAGSHSSEGSQAFDTTRWMERQEAMLKSARLGVSPRFTNLPLLVGAVGARSVLDLGGGSGWTFELVSRGTPRTIEEYFVVEKQTLVEVFAASFSQDDRVRFAASETVSSALLDSVDVFYSNSTLQYFPDNGFLKELIAVCTPKWILLDDFQPALEGEFFSMQHYYGAEIPYRFCNLKFTIDEMSQLGYALRGNWEYPSATGGHLNPSLAGASDSLRRIEASRSLLFEISTPAA